MLKIEISKRSAKFIKSLSLKQKKQVTTKILELRINPEPHDSAKLKGYEDFRRVDSGEFRIIYTIKNNELIVVLLVGKRNDDEVYRQLKRLRS